SHIMPGPLRGYWKLSISVLTTGPLGLRAAEADPSARLTALMTATPRSSPLMRCAAQSAEISSHDLLSVGLEKNREQPLAELIAYPIMEGGGIVNGKRFGAGE